MKHIQFSKIQQPRQIIKEVQSHYAYIGNDEHGKALYDYSREYPVIEFIQTVKIHGTNTGISYDGNELGYQSRNNIISVDNDNYGFAQWCEERKDVFLPIMKALYLITGKKQVTLLGEFAGKGIQKGVATNDVDKFFVAFAVNYIKDDEKHKLSLDTVKGLMSKNDNVYNIFEFEHKTISIDFNNPDLSINKIVEDTIAIENQCPVAQHFGVKGIGEGVVLSTNDRKYVFKSKGEKHSVSKVKTVSKVDEIMINNITEFVESVVTENRLNQGIEYFNENNIEVEPQNTGTFIKWVQSDVKSEELDLILANNFDWKLLNNAIANQAKKFYLNN